MATGGKRMLKMLPDFSSKNKLEFRRRMLVFSFFLTISAIIWLLNALSKNYTTEIRYPITYSQFPDNKILVSELPENLKLKVNAHGYALLSYKLTNRPIPINFPVSSFAMNRLAGDSSRSYLLTRYAREQVARQLPGELQLLEIAPDSLVFQFATEITRKLPVVPAIDYQVEKGFTLKGPVIVDPDTLEISGPDIYLDTLSMLTTRNTTLGMLQKSYSGVLKIRQYPTFRLPVDEVLCAIELEKLTEIQVSVPIQVVGLPDSLRLQTFPQEIRVTGTVGLSNYTRIVPEAFRIEVDYAEVLENRNRLQVRVVSQPEALNAITFSPQTVEYLLSVK